MSLALTIFAAWFTGCLAAGLWTSALILHRSHEDDDAGVFVALGAMPAWAFLAIVGLTS